jgi:uncharacterized membrane protein (DUF2068 family)
VVTLLLALQGLLDLTLASLALSGVAMPTPGVGEVSLALGLVELLLAWGVWMLKHWAFWGVLPLEALLLGAATVDLFATHPASGGVMVPMVIGGVVIPVIVVLCFWRDRSMRALWQA